MRLAITLIVAACLSIGSATASELNKEKSQELFWQRILDIGQRCGELPRELILSVIWAESRGNPTAVNINGVGGFHPKDAQSALKLIYKYNRANIDLGLMQVNYKTWGPVYGLTPAQLLDPETNVCVGSRILRDYIDEHKGSWKGVGRYNAVSYDKQLSYAHHVYRIYKYVKKRSETSGGSKN